MTHDEILALSAEIRDTMTAHGRTVSTAESCTSGQISALLTAVSGSSGYFQGGITAYQNHLKTKFLGVSATDIEKYDVVSRQVVEQMVRGACRMFGTDYALASTGYADTGTDRIPSGTIWIAWGSCSEVHSLCLQNDCGREENTRAAAEMAVCEFAEWSKSLSDGSAEQ